MNSNLLAPALAALGIISGWALAVWQVRPFRRDTLLDYLNVAKELQESHHEHAQWLRDVVALRVQAHALSDLRPRIDNRQVAFGGIAALLSYAAIFAPGTPRVIRRCWRRSAEPGSLPQHQGVCGVEARRSSRATVACADPCRSLCDVQGRCGPCIHGNRCDSTGDHLFTETGQLTPERTGR